MQSVDKIFFMSRYVCTKCEWAGDNPVWEPPPHHLSFDGNKRIRLLPYCPDCNVEVEDRFV